MCLLNIRFALFFANNVYEKIRRANILVCFELCSRKLSPMPLPAIFKKLVG